MTETVRKSKESNQQNHPFS